ncbi:MAG: glycosyltransferase family 2 protein [Kiritimatiellia bacterium]
MTAPPLFSIVVPSLNPGRFLPQALDSLLAQKASDLEILVVDGGSRDGSAELLQRYAPQLAWWCSEPDAGQSDALAKGFSHASGRYLSWLNADDILLPGMLDAARRAIRSDAPEWIVANQAYIDSEGRVLRCIQGERWHDFLYRRAMPHAYGPSSFFTRELYRRAGGIDVSLAYAMDHDLWLAFLRAGARHRRLRRYGWAFRRHEASKTQGGDEKRRAAEMEEFRRIGDKHGLRATASGVALQRLWRLLDGALLRGGWDTLRFAGKPWSRCFTP